jgi:hypothetical protein
MASFKVDRRQLLAKSFTTGVALCGLQRLLELVSPSSTSHLIGTEFTSSFSFDLPFENTDIAVQERFEGSCAIHRKWRVARLQKANRTALAAGCIFVPLGISRRLYSFLSGYRDGSADGPSRGGEPKSPSFSRFCGCLAFQSLNFSSYRFTA